jgi:3-deoxy-D-manno-octulosonic-acid transferase
MDLLLKSAFRFYNFSWFVALPWLRLNHRLAEGFDQRTLKSMLPAADLWIQAASVGESYMALEIIKTLDVSKALKILVTTNTRQGIDILTRALGDREIASSRIQVALRYFPFDQPALMRRAVAGVRPAAMVLLETEIWPGLLQALQAHNCKTIIINGRLTDKSLKRYLLWPSIWALLRPEKVLAISRADADRFKQLFGRDGIEVMPNIKFDRVASAPATDGDPNKIKNIVSRDTAFAVLASVRREEEPLVNKIVQKLLHKRPQAIIGLFPRHLHRIQAWQKILNYAGIRWVLRSETKTQVTAGTVILWDTFGELLPAFKLCKSAFVGGSLAPLGGQNFLALIVQ